MKLPGWLWMTLSALLFGIIGILVKEAVELDASVYWIGWVRFALGTVLILSLSRIRGEKIKVVNRNAFCLRGAIGSLGQFFMFLAIIYVGLGRGTVLVYLMGVVSTVSAIFILKERPTPLLFLSVVVATAGVFMACNAGFPHGGEWLAIAGAFCCGIAVVFVRLLRRTDSNAISFLSQCVFGAMILTVPAFMSEIPASGVAWGYIVLLTIIDTGGQLCMSQGLSMVSAAKGSAILMLSPVFSIAVGLLLYNETLSTAQVAGCAAVLVSSFIAVCSRHCTPLVSPAAEKAVS